eukprot:1549767-Prorocentrum_lima.AAC.1
MQAQPVDLQVVDGLLHDKRAAYGVPAGCGIGVLGADGVKPMKTHALQFPCEKFGQTNPPL